MELGQNTTFDSTFSNSWLNQRQPTLFNNDNVIERPRSADISSWTLPTTVNTSVPSWKPLGSQHDLDFQHHWKETPSIPRLNSNVSPDVVMDERHSSSPSLPGPSNRNSGFGQFLSPPTNFGPSRSSSADLTDSLHGYGSDHSDSRYKSHVITKPTASTTINENKEDPIDMELLKGKKLSSFYVCV
jgi:hypothetical protein